MVPWITIRTNTHNNLTQETHITLWHTKILIPLNPVVNCGSCAFLLVILITNILTIVLFFSFFDIFFSSVSVQIVIVFCFFCIFLHRNTNIGNTSTCCNDCIFITSCSLTQVLFAAVNMTSISPCVCVMAVMCMLLLLYGTFIIFFKSWRTLEGGCGHPCNVWASLKQYLN